MVNTNAHFAAQKPKPLISSRHTSAQKATGRGLPLLRNTAASLADLSFHLRRLCVSTLKVGNVSLVYKHISYIGVLSVENGNHFLGILGATYQLEIFANLTENGWQKICTYSYDASFFRAVLF